MDRRGTIVFALTLCTFIAYSNAPYIGAWTAAGNPLIPSSVLAMVRIALGILALAVAVGRPAHVWSMALIMLATYILPLFQLFPPDVVVYDHIPPNRVIPEVSEDLGTPIFLVLVGASIYFWIQRSNIQVHAATRAFCIVFFAFVLYCNLSFFLTCAFNDNTNVSLWPGVAQTSLAFVAFALGTKRPSLFWAFFAAYVVSYPIYSAAVLPFVSGPVYFMSAVGETHLTENRGIPLILLALGIIIYAGMFRNERNT